jgi:hypothetical protein
MSPIPRLNLCFQKVFACQQVKKGESIVGNIEQFSRGICTDAFTDTNSFHIQIPRETDIREKALLIGATILMV